MFHLVYLSYEEGPEGRNYIGKHSTEDPYDGYLGSSRDPSFLPIGKIILGVYKSAEAAVASEIQWQKALDVVADPSYANLAFQSSDGFDRTGSRHTLVTRDKMRKPKSVTHRDNIRLSKLGSLNPNYGKSWECTENHKRKVSAALKGVPKSKAHIESVRRSRSKRWMCLISGYVSDKSAVTRFQKKHGISTHLKREVQWQEFFTLGRTLQMTATSPDTLGILATNLRTK